MPAARESQPFCQPLGSFKLLSSKSPDAFARRQRGCGAAVEDGGRGVSAAGRVQRAAGGRAGGPAPAGQDAHRVHPEPEGCAHGEGEEAGGERLLLGLAEQFAHQTLVLDSSSLWVSPEGDGSRCYLYMIPGLTFTFDSGCYLYFWF